MFIPSMRTVNASFYYNFDIGYEIMTQELRLAVKNIDDERAPLADRFYGFICRCSSRLWKKLLLRF